MEPQLGKPPILPITAKLLFTNSFVCFYRQGWYYTLIYQQLLEGGFDPLVLSAATERMLRHTSKLVAYPSTSQPPSYDNLISDCTSINLSIESVEIISLTYHSIYKYLLTCFM